MRCEMIAASGGSENRSKTKGHDSQDNDGQNNRACGPPAHAGEPAAIEVEDSMLKAFGWIILIIFVIGLLVVLGVFKAIF